MARSKVPQMTGKPITKSISVSPFGGVNWSKGAAYINDNQLSDALDIWYYKGALRQRPAFSKVCKLPGKVIDMYPRDGSEMLIYRVKHGDGTVEEKYGRYIAVITGIYALYDDGAIEQLPSSASSYVNCIFNYTVFNLTSGMFVPLPSADITVTEDSFNPLPGTYQGLLFIGSGMYLEVSPFEYEAATGPNSYDISVRPFILSMGLDMSVAAGTLAAPNRLPFYIPTIFTDCTPNGGGNQYEQRNILNPVVKMMYTTIDTSTGNTPTAEVYTLADKNIDSDKDVIVTYQEPVGKGWECQWKFPAGGMADSCDYTITKNPNGYTNPTPSNVCALDRSNGTLTFKANLHQSNQVNAINNMTVQYAKTIYTDNPLLSCTLAVWYGGAYQGADTGDRLFLSGNPTDPNKVWYSSANNPAYFPVDNFNSVGEAADPITAFGKQHNILVVFKKNSIFAISYKSVDADNNSVLTVQSFPCYEIHANIGCDAPNSIQLINNNLVWLNTKLGAFTLLSTVNTDERVVRPISKNINLRLLDITSGSVISSADTGRYYVLAVGQNLFLWDYMSTAYTNTSDTDAAQSRLAWYYWSTLGTGNSATGEIAPALICPGLEAYEFYLIGVDDYLYSLSPKNGLVSSAYCATKAYDFGASGYLKALSIVNVTLDSANAKNLNASVCDDFGNYSFGAIPTISSVSWGQVLRVPCLRRWTHFAGLGFQFSADSPGIYSYEISAKIGRHV